jgi:hypothetical protein
VRMELRPGRSMNPSTVGARSHAPLNVPLVSLSLFFTPGTRRTTRVRHRLEASGLITGQMAEATTARSSVMEQL